MLTKEKEIELVKNYLQGDTDSLQELAKEASCLSVTMAKKYSRSNEKNFHKYICLAYKGFFTGLENYIQNKRYEKAYHGKIFKVTTYCTYFMKKTLERNL